MLIEKTADPIEINQGLVLTIGDDSVRLVPNKGNPNDTSLEGSIGMLVIDTDTGLTYKWDVLSAAFVPSADVTQLPYPGPTPIKIPVATADQELDRIDSTNIRSIIWEITIRNGDVGAYSSNVKAMQLGGQVAYTEYAILELGSFPNYIPTLSVILDGTDLVLAYEGDAGMSVSILRQQVGVAND
jgi:hypothetical protein